MDGSETQLSSVTTRAFKPEKTLKVISIFFLFRYFKLFSVFFFVCSVLYIQLFKSNSTFQKPLFIGLA